VASPRSLVRLRVHMADAASAAARLGLSNEPLSSSGSEPTSLWISPDQWLLVSERQSAEALVAHCRSGLGEMLHNATDATDALDCLVVEGARARALLAMACGLDLEGDSFPRGKCARTRFAKVAAVIHAVGEEKFDVYVDRSVSHYVAQWLGRACREPLLAG
jgi:heterotetrameric sarcosine oxidase gamma subunit